MNSLLVTFCIIDGDYVWWRKSWLTTLEVASSIISFCCLVCSRLCNDKRLAEEVVRLEGLGRLVELCKNESARVGSDGVLVACLAAVRKIAAAVGPEKFKNLDATELVEPRLLDSFLIFSSRNESFVWTNFWMFDWFEVYCRSIFMKYFFYMFLS